MRVLIGFPDTPTTADEALVRAAGGEVHHRYQLVPAMAATVPVTALDGLSRNPRVTVIEPDGIVHVVDAELENTWGVKHIGSGAVHASGNLGDGIKVAIVDTGIDYTHPDLDGNYAGGTDEVNDDGVRVLSVFPGRTASLMQERVRELEELPYTPDRLLQPEEVASAILQAISMPRTAEMTVLMIRPHLK